MALRPSSVIRWTTFDNSFRRFCEGRDGNADDFTVVGRVQAKIRRTYRFFERDHQRGIERLRHDERGLWHREGGHLVDRHLRAVGLDVHVLENANRRAPRAHACELVLHVVERGIHPLVDLEEQPFQIIYVHVIVSTSARPADAPGSGGDE
jgi:hypothetical protein